MTEFRIVDTFTASLARLTEQEQKAAKITVFDLQAGPSGTGLSFHRLVPGTRVSGRCGRATTSRYHPQDRGEEPFGAGWDTRVALSASPPDGFAHPDAQRRFRLIADSAELARALDFPWEKWTVFLHPAQRALVERHYSGPARVAGSAGTGKTVVALHRAVHLAHQSEHPDLLDDGVKDLGRRAGDQARPPRQQ